MHTGPRPLIVAALTAFALFITALAGCSSSRGAAAFDRQVFRSQLRTMPAHLDAVMAQFQILNAAGGADRSRAYTDYTRELKTLTADAQMVSAAAGDSGLGDLRGDLRSTARNFRWLSDTLNDFQVALSKDMRPGTVLRIGAAYQPVLDQAAAVRAALVDVDKRIDAAMTGR